MNGRLSIRIDKNTHEDLEAMLEFYSEVDKCWKVEVYWSTITKKAYEEMLQRLHHYQVNGWKTEIVYTFDKFTF